MTKENKSLKIKTSSRRKFFKTAAKAGAVAAATVAMPNIARADGHVTLKMQAAWPSGANIFFEWLVTTVTWLRKCLEVHLRLIFNQLEQL